jgi:hypothetical protein
MDDGHIIEEGDHEELRPYTATVQHVFQASKPGVCGAGEGDHEMKSISRRPRSAGLPGVRRRL